MYLFFLTQFKCFSCLLMLQEILQTSRLCISILWHQFLLDLSITLSSVILLNSKNSNKFYFLQWSSLALYYRSFQTFAIFCRPNIEFFWRPSFTNLKANLSKRDSLTGVFLGVLGNFEKHLLYDTCERLLLCQANFNLKLACPWFIDYLYDTVISEEMLLIRLRIQNEIRCNF